MMILKLQQLERTRTDCGPSKGAVMALHNGRTLGPYRDRATAEFFLKEGRVLEQARAC